MCGIFGYVGANTDLGPALMAALQTLEYRGYDSWGGGGGAGAGLAGGEGGGG